MPGGHTSKTAQALYNISGLRNQLRSSSIISDASSHTTPLWCQAPSPDGDESDLEEDDYGLDLLIHTYSITFYMDTIQCNQRGLRHVRRAQMSCPNPWGHNSAMLLLFKAPSYSPRVHGTKSKGKSSLSPVVKPDQQPTMQPPPQPEPSLPTPGPSQSSQVRLAPVHLDPIMTKKTDQDWKMLLRMRRPNPGDLTWRK